MRVPCRIHRAVSSLQANLCAFQKLVSEPRAYLTWQQRKLSDSFMLLRHPLGGSHGIRSGTAGQEYTLNP